MPKTELIQGDCLEKMKDIPAGSVNCCVTSPPYFGLRDYGHGDQIGIEETPAAYVAKLVAVFREVKRVLRDDGTLWLNLGDSYASSGRTDRKESPGVGAKQEMKAPGRKLIWEAGGGHNFSWFIPDGNGGKIKPKDLMGIPWRVAFALQADGWYLRQDIIWHKPNPMPESVTDRCTKSHEYIFLLSKSAKYYCDMEAIKEPADTKPHKMGGRLTSKDRNDGDRQDVIIGDGFRNKRSVWTVVTQSFPEAHFATFPPKLIEPCILAGTKKGDVVFDPFMGAGTTAVVALKHRRDYVGTELNPEYVRIAERRIEAIVTGVPIKEARNGQLGLFEEAP